MYYYSLCFQVSLWKKREDGRKPENLFLYSTNKRSLYLWNIYHKSHLTGTATSVPSLSPLLCNFGVCGCVEKCACVTGNFKTLLETYLHTYIAHSHFQQKRKFLRHDSPTSSEYRRTGLTSIPHLTTNFFHFKGGIRKDAAEASE